MLLQDTVGFPDYFGSISGTSSKAVNVTWSRATEVTLMNGMFSHLLLLMKYHLCYQNSQGIPQYLGVAFDSSVHDLSRRRLDPTKY